MTATPRHYDIHSRKKNDEAKLLYSMDSLKDYGPRAFTLTFRQAVKLNIISDYKVLVSLIVTDKKMQATKDSLYEHAISLQKAIVNHDIKKIITFHNSIENAGKFTHFLNSTKSIPNFHSLHINSFMKVSERTKGLNQFKFFNKALISNARCLTEGTNVPAVDMVAFLNRKNSKIDIVQAVGRAMRKYPGKKIGYVFLPLFVEVIKGEDFELAVNRTHYEVIWEILQALSEQDEDLHQTINYLNFKKGKEEQCKELTRLNKFIEILPSSIINVDLLDSLKESIAISVINNIGSSWYEMYGRLCTFHERYGHCIVTAGNSGNQTLCSWVQRQRSLRKKNELSAKKIRLLNKLDFSWDPHEENWNKMYNNLKKYYQENGHSNVPNKYHKDKILASWVLSQRAVYKKNKLSPIKIQLLNQINFLWHPIETRWYAMYNQLKNFKTRYKHINVPNKNNWKLLYRWSCTQRYLFKKNKLSNKKILLLEKLNFIWDPLEEHWKKQYQELISFKVQHGHCNVPFTIKLGEWLHSTRKRYKLKTLPQDKINLLEKIGVEWEPCFIQKLWFNKFNRLIAFKNKFGHCNVPCGYKNDKQLATWMHNQRYYYRKNMLSNKKIIMLNNIGFEWNAKDHLWKSWMERYNKLITFKKQFGHCKVTRSYSKEKKLVSWVNEQRHCFKTKKLSRKKIQLLNKIGFDWTINDKNWNNFYKQLIIFKKRFGHFNVPNSGATKSLRNWINNQRINYNNKKISLERITSLNKLNFIWKIKR